MKFGDKVTWKGRKCIFGALWETGKVTVLYPKKAKTYTGTFIAHRIAKYSELKKGWKKKEGAKT